MLEQVELKIQELKKKQAEEYYKKKDADLTAWGLTTKKDGKKSTPIIVTDEEYEALIEASNGVGRSGRNSIAIAFNVMSVIIMIIGIAGGIVVKSFAQELGFIYFSLTVLGCGVIALIFRGLAEAIRLLQQLVDNRSTVIPEDQKAAYEAEKAARKAAKAKAPAAEQPPVYQQAAPAQQQAAVYVQQPVYAQQPVYQQGAGAQTGAYQQAVQPGVYQQPVYVQQPVYAQQPVAYPQQAPTYPQQSVPAQYGTDTKK